MLLEAISSWVIEMGLSILPKMISRRLYPTQKIAEQIKIDLRSNPIAISPGDVPSVSLWFQISNMSPLNLVLDRLLIEFWVSQPTLYGKMLARYEIPKSSHRDDVYFRDSLSETQLRQIKLHINQDHVIPEIWISVDAYFESNVGMIFVRKGDLRVYNLLCKGLS
jgi:hypothetical protein